MFVSAKNMVYKLKFITNVMAFLIKCVQLDKGCTTFGVLIILTAAFPLTQEGALPWSSVDTWRHQGFWEKWVERLGFPAPHPGGDSSQDSGVGATSSDWGSTRWKMGRQQYTPIGLTTPVEVDQTACKTFCQQKWCTILNIFKDNDDDC